MVKLSQSRIDPLAAARQLADRGLQVFPARYRDKFTLVKWQQYQDIDSRHMLDKWFKGRGHINFWVMTGQQSGYVVVDADTVAGDKWWREQFGDEIFDATAQVSTAKGTHYWFKIPEDWDKPIQSWSVHPNGDDEFEESFDFRADKTGVIVPPSIHESGKQYEWARPLDVAVDAPLAMLSGAVRENAPVSTGDAGGTTTGSGGTTRSLLSRLLSQPPSGEGSGRNDWLARVAGHYAKTWHNQEDLYRAHCEQANNSMGEPLDEAEFNKTIESIWRGEHERNDYRRIDGACGYLASGTTNMLCQVVVNRGEDKAYEFVEYADFDLVAKGVMTDEAGARTYWAEIVRTSRMEVDKVEKLDIILRAEVLGDDRALRKFLARFACTVVPPDNMWPKVGSPGVRIQRYLESQRPPVVRINPALGFEADALGEGQGGFVTHDGIITSTGLVPLDKAAVRADPRLKSGGMAPHDYGFEDNPVVAQDILREVLTFHHDAVTTVYGAYWAACLLKPQIEARTSLFPFMAVEAPSESGKTNGFFHMMTQMNGNTRGEVQPTKAALRDMAAAHRNGMVWVDDLDDPAYLMELLRAATSGGSLTKMGEDRESVKNTQIVSPIVISGEALGLGTQKALVDRAIVLKATSPTSRRSLHNPKRPQWDDVLAVRDRYPIGLHALAGWYVQDALGVVPQTLDALTNGRTGGSGRTADKVAVLRAGARLLDHLVRDEKAWSDEGLHASRLEQWLTGNLTDEGGVAITSDENALTYEVIPWAMRNWHYPDHPSAGEHVGDSDTPVYVKKFEQRGQSVLFGDDVEIYFRVDLLADAWEQHKRGSHEKRTTTAAALKDQAMALGAKSKQVKIQNGGGRRASYWMITGSVAKSAIERSLGG